MEYLKKVGLFLLIFALGSLLFFSLRNFRDNMKIKQGVFFLNKILKIEKESVDKEDKNKENEDKPVKILFAGDLMLDRYNRVIVGNKGVEFFTQELRDIFEDNDLNVANLEGPITEQESVSIDTEVDNPAHFKFTFDKSLTKDFLNYNKINLVNLGNNHILNFGESGARSTMGFLEENKVEYFGSPLDDNNYIKKEIGGKKIVLINYNRFYKLGSEKVVEKIKSVRDDNDLVIIYTHWGNEYKLIQSEIQTQIAHSFIDAGADLVVGSHPHVVQPIEIYKNKAIFYSLGNFVFDQFFSEDVKNELIVKVSFFNNQTSFELVPIYRESSGKLIAKKDVQGKNLLDRMTKDSIGPQILKDGILKGEFYLGDLKK